jgi:hypothetical protein
MDINIENAKSDIIKAIEFYEKKISGLQDDLIDCLRENERLRTENVSLKILNGNYERLKKELSNFSDEISCLQDENKHYHTDRLTQAGKRNRKCLIFNEDLYTVQSYEKWIKNKMENSENQLTQAEIEQAETEVL